MSDTYIPPFPTGNNSSSEANYTQAFEKARQNRNKQTGPTEPESVKPKTPQHHQSTKPGSKPVKANYSLNQQGSGSSKSGGSNNGSSKSGSSHNGSSRSRSSHNDSSRSGNPNYSHTSPKPARSGREREKKEGQVGKYSSSPYNNNMGYNSPYNNNNNNSPYNNNAGRRSEQGRSNKKQGGQTPLQDGILPPFPTGTDTGSNYTEMFNRYHKDNMSPNAPAVQPYKANSEIPTHKTGCCCVM